MSKNQGGWDNIVRKLQQDVNATISKHVSTLREQKDNEVKSILGNTRRGSRETVSSSGSSFNPYSYINTNATIFCGSKEEGVYTSLQMDSIRALQRWLHKRYIHQKWVKLTKQCLKSEEAVTNRQRIKKILDFVESERSYFRLLQTIIRRYVIPLRQGSAPVVVSNRDVEGLFHNLPILFTISNEFVSHLENQYHKWPLFPLSFGEAFYRMSQHAEFYAEYIENYTKALSVLSDLHKLESFRSWQANLSKNTPGVIDDKDLSEHLIAPARRLTQYAAIFEQLLAVTNSQHQEYSSLQFGAKQSAQLVEQMSLKITQAENVLQVFEIQKKFQGPNVPNFVKPYRRFVRYATLLEVGDQPTYKFIVLFNDIIVVGTAGTNQQIGTYNFGKVLSLRKASVKPIPDHPPTFTNSFMLATSSGVVSFCCQSKQQLKEWLNDFEIIFGELNVDTFSVDTEDNTSDKAKEGFLMYCAKNAGNWKSRWCSFDHGLLNICDSYRRAREVSIGIKDFHLVLMTDKEAGRKYCFELRSEETSYMFGAADKDDFDQWVNILMPLSNQNADDDETTRDATPRTIPIVSSSPPPVPVTPAPAD